MTEAPVRHLGKLEEYILKTLAKPGSRATTGMLVNWLLGSYTETKIRAAVGVLHIAQFIEPEEHTKVWLVTEAGKLRATQKNPSKKRSPSRRHLYRPA